MKAEYEDTVRLIQSGETHLDSLAEGFTEVHILIKSAPSVEAEPVRHGRWIEKPYLLGTSRFCSLCGSNYGMPHEVYNFCPNCGAKMDLEENHGKTEKEK